MAALFRRLRTQHRAASAAVSMLAIGMGAFSIATPAASAAAPSPWWHLGSGARPTYLSPDGGTPGVPGEPEIQEITVPLVEFDGFQEQGGFLLVVGEGTAAEEVLGEFVTEPLAAEEGFPPLDVAHLRTALEGPYGAGTVHVAEASAPGVLTFTVESGFTNAAITVVQLFSPGPSATITQRGTPGTAATPDGEIVVTAENLGDASIDGSKSPVKITDLLPSGLEPVGIVAGVHGEDLIAQTELPCTLGTLTCEFPCKKAITACEVGQELAPYNQIEVRIAVNVGPGAHTGEVNEALVSGGGIKSATIARPITVSTEPVPFSVQEYELESEVEGGAPATQAASHPFQSTTTISLSQLADTNPFGNPPKVDSGTLPKDLSFNWPAGLIGNPNPFPVCTATQFQLTPEGQENTNSCPDQSAVGVVSVTVASPGLGSTITTALPLFNLEPHPGEPARFGFLVGVVKAPGFIDTAVRSNGDYGITVSSFNITQVAGLLSARVTVWGDPGDPRHALSRGWGCLAASKAFSGTTGPCIPTAERFPPAFLSLPTACAGPLQSSVTGDSWSNPFALDALPVLASDQLPGLEGCNRVPFSPTIAAEPTSNAATSPSGLNFDLNFDDEGLENSEGLTQSAVKKVVVTLPEGFTTNPSVAEGLHACSLAAYRSENFDSTPGSGCPENSKIGDVTIESPLVKQKILGSLFVAKQGENPNGDAQHPGGNLLTIYLVAKNPELGILVTQALKVVPNPLTGQLVTEVDNVPQLPFSKFHLSFRQGQRSPLITPPTCGPYTVAADLYPYSSPTVALHDTSSFQITQGPEGQGCPNGTPPFHPNLEAGTTNNAAGTYSPFYTHITRKDSEQEITRFSIKLPPGVIGKLAGVSSCSDAQIAAAKAREKEGGGQEELNSPSCPANSEVGHSLVGSGVGNVLAYAPGKLYLAGPYHGSQLSLVSITAAKVGPFDLGTVVVRFALKIDPETAEVSVDGVGSDPIPHIVDGIPIHLRDLRAYVDRPNFTLNPTSCAKKSTASTILGSGLDFVSPLDDNPVTVSSPFQAADCASLGFKPKLKLSLKGGTKRSAVPRFKAVLTYPKGGAYANIAKAQVTLPSSVYLEQNHIRTVCTKVIFAEGAIPGEKCPAASIYGHASAVTPLLDDPIQGPVYLRSPLPGHLLPDLVAALSNGQISVDVVGRIDSVHRKGSEISLIRNSFEAVPDAPVSKFVLEMQGGKKGLLVNSTNICKGTHRAKADFTGQNGKIHDFNPVLEAASCGKGGKKKHHGRR